MDTFYKYFTGFTAEFLQPVLLSASILNNNMQNVTATTYRRKPYICVCTLKSVLSIKVNALKTYNIMHHFI